MSKKNYFTRNNNEDVKLGAENDPVLDPNDEVETDSNDSGDTPEPVEPDPVDPTPVDPEPTPGDSSDDSGDEPEPTPDPHHDGDPTAAGYYIQVNEYALEDAKFERVESRLHDLKVNHFVTATGIILAGPYATEEDATTERIRLIRKGLKGRIIYYEI